MKQCFRPLVIAALLATASVQAETTITVASFPDLDRSAKSAIEGFKKLNPGIEIKVVTLSYGDHHNAMTTALATGANLPDVMAVDMGFIGKFAESGGLEDLAKAPYNGMQYKSKISSFSYPQAMSSTGALAAIPCDIGPGTMLYRKDIIEKAGLTEADLTKSWESFIASGATIKAKTGAWLLPSALDVMNLYIRANLKDGEGIYFSKGGKPTINSPRFQKAFELAKAVRTAGVDANVNTWTSEWTEAYKQGKFATQFSGAWMTGHLNNWLNPEQKGNWRVAQLPGGSFASWGGSFYAIPSKTANKAAAWEFIKYLTLNKEQQLLAFSEVDAYPSLLEAQADKAALDKQIDYLGGQQARQIWKVAADKVPAINVDKYDVIASEIVGAELDNVLNKNKDIKQATADAEKQIVRRVRR